MPLLQFLATGHVLSWHTQRPQTLEIVRGRAWVTQSGRWDDHWLQAGQRLALLPGSRVVLEASGTADLAYRCHSDSHPPAWFRWLQRGQDWLSARSEPRWGARAPQ